ncbi:Xyloglucan galactosyltransferase KATAMARI1 [Melia azedarach]|uniref:Xyloglucan galactosyltransferase KATAMARI1 n=1 Tax=Melia azedarach TaxID=155640 RepID=A0ACC1YPU7_MELAZ|nr:Xyloglucan galactosyltransferase KATAMARI1 [Melia azedarach]
MDSKPKTLIKYWPRTEKDFCMKTYGDAVVERTIIRHYRNRFWYLVFTTFIFWFLFLYIYKSSTMASENEVVTLFGDNNSSSAVNEEFSHNLKEAINDTQNGSNSIKNLFVWGDWVRIADDVLSSERDRRITNLAQIRKKKTPSFKRLDGRRNAEKSYKRFSRNPGRKNEPMVKPHFESCEGRYIYVHHLPRRFNEDLLRHCRSLSEWINMCEFTSNNGLGPNLRNPEKVYSKTGWFATNQFLLEVIFHNRMKQYKCLTSNSSLASAIFVPYYPGLDLSRYLWSNTSTKMKDLDSLLLLRWLRQKPEWKRMMGRDHFLVAGRISWDFRRDSGKISDWGNKLLLLPESKKMTTLVIESSPWNTNDFAIPYPTYFHPSSDDEVFEWQNRMWRRNRPFLFSFADSPRPEIINSIRSEIMDQCRASRKCKLLECDNRFRWCSKPVHVMKMFQSSDFCLQPEGDSFTRRSTFDSILAGCIPVFFHPGSAYVQYIWHLPKDYTKYSVFIPDIDVKYGKASIERILDTIPKEKVLSMREEVIKLIPRLIYADPNSRLETMEDAFDITVKGVLDRIESIRRGMKGNNFTDIEEKFAWKYNLFGTVREHEWDPFFVRPRTLKKKISEDIIKLEKNVKRNINNTREKNLSS